MERGCYRLTALLIMASAEVNAVRFDPAFLIEEGQSVADLSQLDEQSGLLPGTYLMEWRMNERSAGLRETQLLPGEQGLLPCLSAASLEELGVNLAHLPAEGLADACVPFTELIAGASTEVDSERLQLILSIPQAALHNRARGTVPEARWQRGINAGMLNYSLHGSQRWGEASSRQQLMTLQSGINLGEWRWRDYSTLRLAQGETRWRHLSSQFQRDIVVLRSQLQLGDLATTGELFDSLSLRGVQLSSDNSMLPDSLRGFAPVIRGVARGPARVEVRQQGALIRESQVPPGAFVIDDLYPLSSRGTLDVEIIEQDGSRSGFSVPFSSLPVLQREGRGHYSLSAGRLRLVSGDRPWLLQNTVAWGLPWQLTAYGGSQLAEEYQSLAAGLGVNGGRWGAMSLDLTHARHQQASGEAWRWRYARYFSQTQLQLSAYRYATSGYRTFSEAAQSKNRPDTVQRKQRVDLSLTQTLGSYGSLWINGSWQNYWQQSGSERSLQLGYSGVWRGMTFNLSYSHNQLLRYRSSDRVIGFNLIVPLDRWLSKNRYANRSHTLNATAGSSVDNHGNAQFWSGISGSAGEGHALSYRLQQRLSNQSAGSSSYASAAWRSRAGNLDGAIVSNARGQQLSWGLSGGVVLHPQGVTFTQPLGETNILVSAPGVANLPLEQNGSVKTDWRGYAVVPWASPYRWNRVAPNLRQLEEGYEIEEAVQWLAPKRGALVRAHFDVKRGYRVLMTLRYRGNALPFGALVAIGNRQSIVGDEGEVWLTGLPATGELQARWGKGAGQQCRLRYRLPDDAASGIQRLQGECQ
ncbi:fimbria/pilus outer membrane usher protein [Duffyella gerundensis]|uniref:fimbria/pilus outer membrane usher protein n=1 Tax=Duffyella gerundensis TaxID=1619313 RepID=UPI0021F7E4A7|nr:fimbria/pilus outer membrane usher protein [Duffyella gerundensis]